VNFQNADGSVDIVDEQTASVLIRRKTAGPSTAFGAKSAPNFAQDDPSLRDVNRANADHADFLEKSQHSSRDSGLHYFGNML